MQDASHDVFGLPNINIPNCVNDIHVVLSAQHQMKQHQFYQIFTVIRISIPKIKQNYRKKQCNTFSKALREYKYTFN